MNGTASTGYPGDAIRVVVEILDRYGNVLRGPSVRFYYAVVTADMGGDEAALVGIGTFSVESGEFTPVQAVLNVVGGDMQLHVHADVQEVFAAIPGNIALLNEFPTTPLDSSRTVRVHPFCRLFHRLEVEGANVVCVPCDAGSLVTRSGRAV